MEIAIREFLQIDQQSVSLFIRYLYLKIISRAVKRIAIVDVIAA
jgi:hypothetical protein